MDEVVTPRTALVVTTIAGPNDVLRSLAEGALANQWPFYIIGDVASPPDFSLSGARFLSVQDQLATGLALAAECPLRHYARKNIGYLLAMGEGASVIVETDDDNRPSPAFWSQRTFSRTARLVQSGGWANVYAYFGDPPLWPRGFPLDCLRAKTPDFESMPESPVYSPIQQGLVDGDPDVDAIYRLTLPLPVRFRKSGSIAISSNTWCPFNSQNTTWASEAFTLLYLPAYCSFRMTDIWRSFVAQRIADANQWPILFHEATVHQERGEHDLMRDFQDEIPGYLHNRSICETLARLDIKSGQPRMRENLFLCYETLVAAGYLDQRELRLLGAWMEALPR